MPAILNYLKRLDRYKFPGTAHVSRDKVPVWSMTEVALQPSARSMDCFPEIKRTNPILPIRIQIIRPPLHH